MNNKGFWFLNGVGGLLLMITITCVLHPDLRIMVRKVLMPERRAILSTVSGTLLGGNWGQVVKIKSNKGIFIEIYGAVKDGVAPLIDRIRLIGQKDAHFTYNGKFTNLALDDIDGDQKMEIIVPTYDKDLLAHVNVYKYDENQKIFKKIKK